MVKSARWLAWGVLGLPLGWACSDGPVTVAELDATAAASSVGGAGGVGGSAAGAAGDPGTGGNSGGTTNAPTVTGSGGTGTPVGAGVGEDCSENACRTGLACEDDVCEL